MDRREERGHQQEDLDGDERPLQRDATSSDWT
jgi:hypothetical protein